MKKSFFLILLSFFIQILSSQVFYFDSEYKGVGKGTIRQPFNRWTQISWQNGSKYLFKKGTVIKTENTLRANANDIFFGSYGVGNLPKIISEVGSSEKVLDLGGLKNVTLSDFEIESTKLAESCVHFFKSPNASIKNCKLSGAQWGLRNAISEGIFKVIGCEIYNTADDGIFIMQVDTVSIADSYVHDVNNNYRINTSEKFSGGDCIQLVDVKYFTIKSNKLDHSSNGNKFCFISSSKDPQLVPTGIIEGNQMVRSNAKDDGDLIYLIGSENVEVLNNQFFYGEHAIYNHSKNLNVYKNLFVKQLKRAIYNEPKNASECSFYNNTFIEVPEGINSVSGDIELMNNIFYKIKSVAATGNSNIISFNNCFFPQKKIGLNVSDSASFVADPLFRNEEKNDFHLRSSSPCIGKSKVRENQQSTKKMAILETGNIGAF